MAEQLPTSSLSRQKLEKKNSAHGDCDDSPQCKNRGDLGSRGLENGMYFTPGGEPEKGMGRDGRDGEDLGQRTWNLRSRTNFSGRRGSGVSNPASSVPEDEKKNEKPRKFSVALTREEIEQDFIKMTGSKPPRRSNKRPKNLQRAIDNLRPGLWLHDVTPSSYDFKGKGAK